MTTERIVITPEIEAALAWSETPEARSLALDVKAVHEDNGPAWQAATLAAELLRAEP